MHVNYAKLATACSPPPSLLQGTLSNILIRLCVELGCVWSFCEAGGAWLQGSLLQLSLLNPHPLNMCFSSQDLSYGPFFLFSFILTKGTVLDDKGRSS